MVVARPESVPVALSEKPGRRAAGKYASIVLLGVAGAWGALSVDHWGAWIFYWVLASLIHLGLLASGHELVHHHLFASRKTNNTVSYLVGFVTLVPSAAYRFYHLKHHAKLGTDEDPEGILGLELSRLELFGALTISGFMVLGDLWSESVKAAIGRPLRWGRGDKARRALKVDLAVLAGSVSLIVILTTMAGFRGVAFVWLIPVVVSLSFWSAFIALPEHYGLTGGPTDISRNVVSNRLFSWLYWNTNFHATHHWAPHVPYNHLRAATALREWPNEESSYALLWVRWAKEPTPPVDEPVVVLDLRDSVIEAAKEQRVEDVSLER